MKRVWIGAGIAVFLIAAAFFSLTITTQAVESIESEITYALDASVHGGWREAVQRTDRALELWKANRPLFNVLQSHDPLELIEASMAGLHKYAEYEDLKFFQANGNWLLEMLACVRENDIPMLGNIF